MRAAVIDGGGAAHRALQGSGRPFERLEPIEQERLAEVELSAFDLVVVPRSCDADVLAARRHQIRRYLDRGGVLVSFGELWSGWLPGARWEPENAADLAAPPRIAAHPLLAGLTPEDLWWHQGPARWCCHGHVQAPLGAEVLVANSAGEAWLYVDRTTTRGTIVSGSNLDLDTHAHHGNEIAERLLVELLAWAEREAERTAEIRAAGAPETLLYFSGVHFQRGFLESPDGDRFAALPAAELAAVDLAAYRGLWIPRESDQRTLLAERDRIVDHVQRGGRVVSLEEIDRPWLPGVSWEPGRPDLTRARRADHPLVAALGDLGAPWHAHGTLALPDGADVLIETEDGRALLGTYASGDGRVLAGTIDADAHAGYGSDLPRPFLDAALAWLTTEERVPAGVA